MSNMRTETRKAQQVNSSKNVGAANKFYWTRLKDFKRHIFQTNLFLVHNSLKPLSRSLTFFFKRESRTLATCA